MPVMNPATNLIYNMDKNMVASKRGHRLEIKLARCFDPPPASSTEIFPFTSTEDYNSFSTQTYRLSTKSIMITVFTQIRAVVLIKFFCNWHAALFRGRRLFESWTQQIIFFKLPALLISVTSRKFFWFWLHGGHRAYSRAALMFLFVPSLMLM